MKYWFFDGSDVTGPFALKELTQNKSFNASSLVCPENFSDDGDHWQVAATFDDFKPFFAHTTPPDESTTTFEQEMDTLLQQSSPLLFDETPSDGPGLQIPKKPAKPGPIEDYFNQIKEEDLGDILGIPNPNEDSDMDLAHVLEKQLAKTSSTRRREREQEQESEVDRQTAEELKSASQTHHVATATEVFATKAPLPTATTPAGTIVEKEAPTMPVVESPTMPVIATPAPVAEDTQKASQPAEPEELAVHPAAQAPAPQPAPAVSVRPQPAPQEPSSVPDPSSLRREKIETNSIRARLKQTQEMKDFLHETTGNRLQKEEHAQKRMLVIMLMALAIVGGVLLVFQFHPKNTAPAPAPAQTASAQELPAEPPAVQTPAPPQTPAPVKLPQAPRAAVQPQTSAQEQKALDIVQNHPLSGQRGTLSAYLNRIYKNQLAQGYTGTWGAEPLYKNTYIVKYRLTKTRKEPIIYVFQADVAQGKLTGALNNISLDLVGKL